MLAAHFYQLGPAAAIVLFPYRACGEAQHVFLVVSMYKHHLGSDGEAELLYYSKGMSTLQRFSLRNIVCREHKDILN